MLFASQHTVLNSLIHTKDILGKQTLIVQDLILYELQLLIQLFYMKLHLVLDETQCFLDEF